MNENVIKFYLFGDSICFGQLVGSHQTWATYLAKELEEYAALKLPVIVQNAGVNGNTTRQALERMYYDVLSHRPDYIMIQFGMNDCNYWDTDFGYPRVSEKAFMANIEEMVVKSTSAGCKHCFINTNHPSIKEKTVSKKFCNYDKSNRRYNHLIRKATKRLKSLKLPVSLIDVEKKWISYLNSHEPVSLRSLLLEDGIHLSELGHSVYKQIIPPKVKAALSRSLKK
jgi:acyl-CoA thioesterase-1